MAAGTSRTVADTGSPGPARQAGSLGIPRLLLLSSYWAALGYLWLPLGSQVLTIMIRNAPGIGQPHQGAGVAVLEGVGTLLAVFWQPIAGSLSDRTRSRFGRRKPYIVLGTVGSAVFLLVMTRPAPIAGNLPFGLGGIGLPVVPWAYAWLLLLYFLLQVTENAAQAPYQGLLPDVVHGEHERSRASAFVGSGNLVGLLVGFALVGTFMGMSRPDLALASMAVVLVVSMAAVVLSFPDTVKPSADLKTSLGEVVIGTFRISPRLYSDFLWLMASRLFILVSVAGLQRYAVFFFRDVFFPAGGTKADELASLAGRDLQVIIVLFAIAVSFPAAELSHRLGRKPMIVISGFLGALGTLGLLSARFVFLPGFILAPVSSLLGIPAGLGQVLCFGILVGIGVGMFLSVDWAFMVDVIPEEESGRFLGFSNIATAGSGVLAGFVGGFLIDIFNARGHLLGQPGGYPVTFGVYIVFFVLGSMAVLKVRETRGRKASPVVALGGH